MRRHVRGTVEERFWAYVAKQDGDVCWEWTGKRDGPGYGALWVAGKTRGAHRVSWEMHNGAIPPGMFVCHSCDNRGCVRPDHLWLGTNEDNMQDAANKGRLVRPAIRSIASDGSGPACRNGHDLSVAGAVAFRRNGARRCVQCQREKNRQYHHAVRKDRRRAAARRAVAAST